MEQQKLPTMGNTAKVCSNCHATNPPVENKRWLVCPECEYPNPDYDELIDDPEMEGQDCPSCGEGRLELVEIDNCCALCHDGYVEEAELHKCPYCGETMPKDKRYYHFCEEKRKARAEEASPQPPRWTQGDDSKIAYLRLTCRAKEDRVKVDIRFCEGWKVKAERFYNGDRYAFTECIHCSSLNPENYNPGMLEVTDIKEYPHQTRLGMQIDRNQLIKAKFKDLFGNR